MRKLARKFFALGCLIACLGFVAAGERADAPAPSGERAPRICCSACEGEPPLPTPCYSGCNPDC